MSVTAARPRAALVVVLGGLSAFGPLSIDTYLPALPQLAARFHTGPSQVQLTLTACVAGIALGQLVVGPLSDRLGRRAPLLVGLVGYVVASALCAAAPSIWALAGLRFAQGLAGASGMVIARAAVRDLFSGREIARLFSLLMLVTGVAPILAPSVGAAILRVTSWRGVFLALALIGALLLAGTLVALPETLPPERRHGGGLASVRRTMAGLARNRAFAGYALTLGLAFGAMFAYISGSPFVFQDIHHVSSQAYGAIFGMNALGLIAAGQVNRRLVARHGERRLLVAGTAASAAGAAALVAVVLDGVGLTGIIPSLFVVVASLGFVMPNATALALADHPHVAGSASGLLGVLQFTIGAATAPLVGIAGKGTAVPMAIVIAALAGGAVLVLRLLTRARTPNA